MIFFGIVCAFLDRLLNEGQIHKIQDLCANILGGNMGEKKKKKQKKGNPFNLAHGDGMKVIMLLSCRHLKGRHDTCGYGDIAAQFHFRLRWKRGRKGGRNTFAYLFW